MWLLVVLGRPPRDEAAVAKKRAKRAARGARQYERWLESGGRA